jgi:hypothetical protein
MGRIVFPRIQRQTSERNPSPAAERGDRINYSVSFRVSHPIFYERMEKMFGY